MSKQQTIKLMHKWDTHICVSCNDADHLRKCLDELLLNNVLSNFSDDSDIEELRQEFKSFIEEDEKGSYLIVKLTYHYEFGEFYFAFAED